MFETCRSSRGTRGGAALFLVWTAVLLVRAVSLSGQDETLGQAGGIVAVVGDTVITQTELDRMGAYGRYQTSSDYPQPLVDWHRLQRQHAILDRLIDDKLILHRVQIIEKKEGKDYITEGHIDMELAQRVKRLKKEGNVAHSVEDLYRAYRESLGMNPRETRKFLRDQMSLEKYMWREIYPKRVNRWVSPEESRYYYRSNIDQFTTPERISLRQIFIPRTRRDAQIAVEGIEQALKNAADFVELARTYSQEVLDGLVDQAGRVREYSFAELKSWHPPLPQELRRMKRGEVSGPIVTRSVIHFIKVEDVVSGAPEPFSRAHPQIQRLLIFDRRRIAEQKFLAEERRKTRVEIFLPPLPEKVERPSAVKGGLQQEIPRAAAAERK